MKYLEAEEYIHEQEYFEYWDWQCSEYATMDNIRLDYLLDKEDTNI